MAIIPPQNTTVRNGFKLKYLKPAQVVFGRHANPLIAIANALLNGSITRGNQNGFLWSNHNLLLQIASLGNETGGTGSVNYLGEFDKNAPSYSEGDIVQISLGNSVFIPTFGPNPLNARVGTFVCIKDNHPGAYAGAGPAPWPQYPYPAIENRFWEMIGGLRPFRGNYQADPHTSNATLPDIMDKGYGAPDYTVGDIVQVAPSSSFASAATIPGTYVCVVDQPGPSEFPVFTLTPPLSGGFDYPGRSSWVLLSTWPTATTICQADGSTEDVYADLQPQAPPFT